MHQKPIFAEGEFTSGGTTPGQTVSNDLTAKLLLHPSAGTPNFSHFSRIFAVNCWLQFICVLLVYYTRLSANCNSRILLLYLFRL